MLIFAVFIGLFAGTMSGLIGIGGGIIMIPALVFILNFSQHMSQGTALAAMLPPIGILAVIQYYKHGHINLLFAACMAVGFIAGGYIGSKIAMQISDVYLKKIFGILLLLISIRLILAK